MASGAAALASIMRAIHELNKVPSQAARQASSEIQTLIEGQFASQADPYGNAWAPHAKETIRRWGPHPILTLTGAMGQVSVTPRAGAGITVTLGADYSQFHQTGTANMPARPILPNRGLPESWQNAIENAANEAFERAVK